ncbi:hypothetical protein ACVMIH_004964 [Bradyrhizobium sp. USDA 4503]
MSANPVGKSRGSPEPTCYFQMAQHRNVADPEPAPVVGAEAKPYGHNLPGPAWSADLASLPPERPLGECVDALPDMTACNWEPDAVGPKGGSDDAA